MSCDSVLKVELAVFIGLFQGVSIATECEDDGATENGARAWCVPPLGIELRKKIVARRIGRQTPITNVLWVGGLGFSLTCGDF